MILAALVADVAVAFGQQPAQFAERLLRKNRFVFFAVLVRFGVDRIAAEIGATLLDADLAFLLFGQPDAER